MCFETLRSRVWPKRETVANSDEPEAMNEAAEDARREELRRRRSLSVVDFYSGAAAAWRTLGNRRQATIYDSRAQEAEREARRHYLRTRMRRQ